MYNRRYSQSLLAVKVWKRRISCAAVRFSVPAVSADGAAGRTGLGKGGGKAGGKREKSGMKAERRRNESGTKARASSLSEKAVHENQLNNLKALLFFFPSFPFIFPFFSHFFFALPPLHLRYTSDTTPIQLRS